MKVLVDTCIWSLAFRRNQVDFKVLETLKDLVNDNRLTIIGAIRQEVLSGIKSEKSFTLLKEKLKAFKDIPLTSEHYELAAEYYNICQRKGIQGSHIDYLICAVSVRENMQIFSIDKDFIHYQKHLPISLF